MADEYDGDLGHESTEHQTAYVFAPKSELAIDHSRPTKRQKVNKQPVAQTAAKDDEELYFPTLLGGAESKECVKLRQNLYEETWTSVESKIQEILNEANEKTLAEVTSFLSGSSNHEDGSIPTGLIVTGPNIASQELLFSQLADRIGGEDGSNAIVVNLRSGDATNLKAVLKKLARDATNEEHEDEDEKLPTSANDGQKLLNYDLQILHNYLGDETKRQVVVAFQDSEAFDSSLLTELILLFRSWQDRIPFAILFGVATSVELFHERLPRSAIICLQGTQFDVENTSTTLQKIFDAIIVGQDQRLRFGPNFLGSLLERQHDHVQSLQAFIAALKYAYMTHFYANPLSIFNGNCPDDDDGVWSRGSDLLQPEHGEALRMLPSFKTATEAALQRGDTTWVRSVLDDDTFLVSQFVDVGGIQHAYSMSQVTKLKALNGAVSLVAPAAVEDPIELYMKFMMETINDSAIIVELSAACKRLSPSSATRLVRSLITLHEEELGFDQGPNSFGVTKDQGPYGDGFVDTLKSLEPRFNHIVADEQQGGTPIRSIYAQQAQTIRTTVIDQKVQLSKNSASLSKQDAAFSKLIDMLVTAITSYFDFESPYHDGHEIWFYDAKSPYRETFTPRPRHAIERALSAPHDYLGCSCCRGSGGLSASQPPSAILYQLYLETGGLINVFDLWSAFRTIVSGENDGEEEERKTLMLFYQALADLKLMGAVRMSRRKTDHLSKLAWKGL